MVRTNDRCWVRGCAAGFSTYFNLLFIALGDLVQGRILINPIKSLTLSLLCFYPSNAARNESKRPIKIELLWGSITNCFCSAKNKIGNRNMVMNNLTCNLVGRGGGGEGVYE